jgi:hypothetical protein
MTSAYSLPTQIDVSGTLYDIRTDFRVILDILQALNDPDAEAWEKQEIMFRILYVDYEKIPASDFTEACKKAVKFIDCGMPESKSHARTMDWEQDASIIIPAVNKVAGREIRAVEYLHWWTFMGFFMEIEDGLFSQVLAIRQKKAKRQKLEKWEKEFERNNPELVKLKMIRSAEQQREIANLEKWL